MAQNIWTIFYS